METQHPGFCPVAPYGVLMIYPAITTVVPSAIPSVSLTTMRTVGGSPLSIFDLVALDAGGDLVPANASQGSGTYEVTGVSQAAAVSGAMVDVVELLGMTTPMRFAAAPLASDNGQPVYLSTVDGEATLTAPTAPGNVVFRVGILAGGDGVSLAPSVIWRPRFISWRS